MQVLCHDPGNLLSFSKDFCRCSNRAVGTKSDLSLETYGAVTPLRRDYHYV